MLGPNLIDNPNMTGGSAPSTLPFGWFTGTQVNIGTVTATYAYGTESSISYIDLILTGTPGANGIWKLIWGAQFTAVQVGGVGENPLFGSRNYQVSANMYAAAGSWTNIVPNLVLAEYTPSGFIRNDIFYVGSNTTGLLNVNAFSGSVITDPTNTRMWGQLWLNFAAASAISITLRFGNGAIQLDDGLQLSGQQVLGWY